MESRPIPDKAERRPRLDIPDDHLTVQVELPLLALMLGMEVRWLMLPVEHPNDNPEEHRDDRHTFSLACVPTAAHPVPPA